MKENRLIKMSTDETTYFCQSAKLCLCIDQMKNSFFTEYKRFGIYVYIEGCYLKIESTRSASRGNYFVFCVETFKFL